MPRRTAGELGFERVCGVIDSAVEAVLETDAEVVGVVGGARTIGSGAYRRPLRAAGLAVRQRVAQPLSAMIEAGLTGSLAFRAEAARVMAPLERVDALVLGCTHYWAAIAQLRGLTRAAVIVDPARETLDRVVSGWFEGRSADGDRPADDGRPVEALQLTDLVLAVEPAHAGALGVALDAGA